MSKPGMLITGAAGYLGSQLIPAFQPTYEIFAVDRRLPQAGGAPEGPGIHWYQVDIANLAHWSSAVDAIGAWQPIDLVLHLAGYYDFTGEPHPEYQRSNVDGMRNVLELVPRLSPKRLIFTSSIAACPFPSPGQMVNENSLPHGSEPYSVSKRAGEELLAAYRDRVPSLIVRLAAIFTDWCEYEPLTNFLHTWTNGGWDARIMGGMGNWAIPYLHMKDLVAFVSRVVERAEMLEPLEILQGSPNGDVSQRQLYDAATQAYFGQARMAIPMPRPLARLGIKMREGLGRVTGHMPFERSWMGNYIDRRLTVDASRTHRRLDWTPRPELGILDRMPIIVGNLREASEEWQRRQERRRSSQIL